MQCICHFSGTGTGTGTGIHVKGTGRVHVMQKPSSRSNHGWDAISYCDPFSPAIVQYILFSGGDFTVYHISPHYTRLQHFPVKWKCTGTDLIVDV